jgi:hypothetical protein
MSPQELARRMVTIERDPSASYGSWRLSIARRATQPKAAPWLQVWFVTRAEANVDAVYFRRAIVDGIREAAALGISANKASRSPAGRGGRLVAGGRGRSPRSG